ncbi:MobF family relaxase [Leptothoe sp. LEGE 181152]|nr:MobF family relaxase [Leptothoe sp. LEGE 181152]
MTASISVAKNRNYYLDLANQDYYHREKSGFWAGKGAEKLGLQGEVTKEDMGHIWKGFAPDGSTKLTQNAGKQGRRSAWDITFSPDKSVSAVWAVADKDIQAKIEAAHHQAVLDAVSYLEDNAYTRRGHGGTRQEGVGLVVATFQHGASRAGDPQLHTHALTMNIGAREDGTFGSIDSQHLYTSKMAAGAVYRSSLATNLEKDCKLPLEYEKDGSFRVSGVPHALTDYWSSRSHQLKEHLKTQGIEETSKNKEHAAVATRSKKEKFHRDTLKKGWQQTAKGYGFTPEVIRSLMKEREEPSEFEKKQNEGIVLREALEKCTYHQSYFQEKELDRALAEASAGKGMTYSDLKSIKQGFMESREAVSLGADKRHRYFTTMEQMDLEANLKDYTNYLAEDRSHSVNSKALFQALSNKPTMSGEQRRALGHVATPGGLKVISGMAGTGKTFFMDAARETFEGSGYKVQGLALSGKAASGLQAEAKIDSRTLDSFFFALDKQRQEQETANKLRTGQTQKKPQFGIDNKTVLMVDEAGMVDTRRMTRLFQEADDVGAKVILVGDHRQLQPVQSGGAFQSVSKQVGTVELKEIRRQQNEWAKQAVHDFADGNAKAGLKAYQDRGLITVKAKKDDLYQALINDWSDAGGVENAKDHLILANTNADVNAINRLAQEKRKEVGALGERHTSINGETLYEGDRVLFRQNDKRQDVKNGMGGTLQKIDLLKKQLTVTLDNQESRTFSKDEYDQLSLGYGVTTHKSQGMTVKNSYVLAGGRMQDRELTYVQMSRAKEQTRIYAQGEAKKKAIDTLQSQMEQSNQKTLARDWKPPVEQAKKVNAGKKVGLSR